VFDGDGYLTITDRLKDVIITSGGKNVAPQAIEIMMAEDPYIEFMAVIGDKKKYLTALIVPSFDNLEVWARKNAIPFSGRDELITHPGVVAFYRRIIDKKQKNLGQVEQIKKFTLLPNEFSQETGEITPTMKIKRKVVQEKYKDLIERMYVEDAAQ
jgi:long-chain acyl-CoA synthetase